MATWKRYFPKYPYGTAISAVRARTQRRDEFGPSGDAVRAPGSLKSRDPGFWRSRKRFAAGSRSGADSGRDGIDFGAAFGGHVSSACGRSCASDGGLRVSAEAFGALGLANG
ncbi:hypothetical protein NN561_008915 [Cricetulus griseus]